MEFIDRSFPMTYHQFLRIVAPTCGLYAVDHTRAQVDCAFKFATRDLEAIPDNPPIEFRSGLFRVRDVIVNVLLFQFAATHAIPIIEMWLNAHNNEREGLQAVRLLGQQNTICLHLLDEEAIPRRTIRMPHHSRQFFTRAAAVLDQATPWSMDAFDRAQAALSVRYPRPDDLWIACARHHFLGRNLS